MKVRGQITLDESQLQVVKEYQIHSVVPAVRVWFGDILFYSNRCVIFRPNDHSTGLVFQLRNDVELVSNPFNLREELEAAVMEMELMQL